MSFLFNRRPSPRNSSWPPRNTPHDPIALLIGEMCSLDKDNLMMYLDESGSSSGCSEEYASSIAVPTCRHTRSRSMSQEALQNSTKSCGKNGWREGKSLPPRREYTYEFGNNAAEIIKSLYNPIERCKSSGVIPYTIHQGQLMFLFQRLDDPIRKKDSGWNDFGGKRIVYYDEPKGVYTIEESVQTAAREFSEETSCLFYANDHELFSEYRMLIDRPNLDYGEKEVKVLTEMIAKSAEYHAKKINQVVIPLYVSSKETYISYFLRVNYLPASDLPRAEDIHIDYPDRYYRTCQWFTMEELMQLPETSFHKRLQITRVQQRIASYYEMDHFIE